MDETERERLRRAEEIRNPPHADREVARALRRADAEMGRRLSADEARLGSYEMRILALEQRVTRLERQQQETIDLGPSEIVFDPEGLDRGP